MSTFKLPVSTSSPPIHVAFSATPYEKDRTTDLLAVLWLSGRIALWVIHTSIEQKKGQKDVLCVKELWNGDIGERLDWARQVWVGKSGVEGERLVGVLAEKRQKDVALFLVLKEGEHDGDKMEVLKTWQVELPSRGGRFVANVVHSPVATDPVVWQDDQGGLWNCKYLDM